ncbi:Uncharacterised protein [Turicibacter sanguinis]|nr:Uncharacterised protein [Turicibacter sanguinis]
MGTIRAAIRGIISVDVLIIGIEMTSFELVISMLFLCFEIDKDF